MFIVIYGKRATILDNIGGIPRPPLPPPQIKDGKMARFALRGASPLIWGNRGLLIQFILDKINGKNLDLPPPPLPQHQGWENGAFLPFAWLHP